MELSFFIIIPSVNCEIHDLYRKCLAVTRVGPEFVADRIGRLGRKELGRVGCYAGGLIVKSLPGDRRLGWGSWLKFEDLQTKIQGIVRLDRVKPNR